jgi:hypothetical protein
MDNTTKMAAAMAAITLADAQDGGMVKQAMPGGALAARGLSWLGKSMLGRGAKAVGRFAAPNVSKVNPWRFKAPYRGKIQQGFNPVQAAGYALKKGIPGAEGAGRAVGKDLLRASPVVVPYVGGRMHQGARDKRFANEKIDQFSGLFGEYMANMPLGDRLKLMAAIGFQPGRLGESIGQMGRNFHI